MPFKKAVFGGDINILTKKRLEARQNLSGGTKSPTSPIISQYPDDTENAYSYQELLNLQGGFGGANDLSSRTPFARMWTAVEIYSTKDSEPMSESGADYVVDDVENKTKIPKDGQFIVREIQSHEKMF